MEISFLVEKFSLIKQHIRIIERTMVRLVDETEEGKYLLSIRGLNYIAVAGLLAVTLLSRNQQGKEVAIPR
jgi:hypothetical protein